jgi:hypothetical protein
LADIVLTQHPATRVLCSRFPVVSIFAANRNSSPTSPIAVNEPEDALITRPGLEVTVRHLPPGGATFLLHLVEGETLGAAAAAAFADCPQFDLSANIAGMIEAGAFTTVNHGDRST